MQNQGTINEKHLRQLMEVELVAETQDQYHATMFRGRLTELQVFPNSLTFYQPTLNVTKRLFLARCCLGLKSFKTWKLSPPKLSREF